MLVELNNRIELVVAAVIMLVVIRHFVRTRYTVLSRSNTLFIRLTTIALVSSVLDIEATVMESYAVAYPNLYYHASILGRMLFNSSTSLLIYYSFLYFNSFNGARKEKSKTELTMLIIAILSVLMHFVNAVLCWNRIYADDFDVSQIEINFFGTVYQGLPTVMLAIILIVVIHDRKYFDKKQIKYIVAFLVLVIVGLSSEMISYYFFERTKLYSMFCVTFALAISVYSLESPNYQRLEETLGKLQLSREDAKTARQKADEANAAKSEFLARMSHEIRTPVNGIIGMDEMILQECNESAIREYATDIKNAANGLISILDDILDFSAANSATFTLKPENYSLTFLLRNIYNIFAIKAKDSRVEIKLDVNENVPAVLKGDELRIRQVVTNLMNNAVKYTSEGCVTLSAIALEKTDSTARIKIAIKDTGMGIKPEDMDRLFSEFERLDLQENRRVEGTGLGLAIVSKLLTIMDSELKVESVYGQGSEFSFVLSQEIISHRLQEAGDNVTPGPKSAENTSGNAFTAPDAKILVVDDNMINLKVFTGVLKNSKMKITEAQSGEECLKLCETEKFDIIFMDHLMPKMDGVETFKKLRENAEGINFTTPVICLTANAIRGAHEEYIKEGFNDAMFKPINPGQLYEAIRKYLPESMVQKNQQ